MRNVECFDVMLMVVEEANKRFGSLWKVDESKQDILCQYCDAIDELAEEFDGESYDVEVDEITMSIKITLECGDMLIKDKNHAIYRLFDRSILFGFSVSKETQMLCVTFEFPGIWEKA